MRNYIVHLVNPVSGWAVSIVHVIEKDAASAVSAACKKFGLSEADLGQTLKAIPVAGEAIAEEAAQEAETEIVEPVLSEAEQEAQKLLASLSPEVLAALKAA